MLLIINVTKWKGACRKLKLNNRKSSFKKRKRKVVALDSRCYPACIFTSVDTREGSTLIYITVCSKLEILFSQSLRRSNWNTRRGETYYSLNELRATSENSLLISFFALLFSTAYFFFSSPQHFRLYSPFFVWGWGEKT